MKKQSQAGFTVVELVILVLVIAAIVAIGAYAWHARGQDSTTTATNTDGSSYQSPPVTTPPAPQVSQSSDLNSAMSALDQTNITANGTDSSELSRQASEF